VSATRRDFLRGTLATGVLSRLSLEQSPTTDGHEELWYDRPAEQWLEALPVGNGRLGGMVYGGIQTERIALSESTAWSGAPSTGEVNPGALEHLKEIRQLFFTGKYDEAQALCGKYLVGHAKNFGTNLPLPELQFVFDNVSNAQQYRRSLRLDEAIAQVRFRADGSVFERQIFASHPDRILVIRLTCSTRGQISFRMSFGKSVLPIAVKTDGEDTLVLDGHAWERMHSTGRDGVALRIRVKVITEAGRSAPGENAIDVRAANSATVLVAIGTSFEGGDPDMTCRDSIQAAARKAFDQLRHAHLVDYQPLYRRVSIDLGSSSSQIRNQPTDLRRKAMDTGANDPGMLSLFFQFGRYLTIAGSRAD